MSLPSNAADHHRVLTLSGTYGAGSSVVGPRLAEELGLAFLDRLVRSATDEGNGSESVTAEERVSTRVSRWLYNLANVPSVIGAAPVVLSPLSDPGLEVRRASEAGIARRVASGDSLILGRAGAVVLAEHPRAFHIRMDGPPERRVLRAMEIEGTDAETARARLADTDRARSQFVRHLYGRDPGDRSLYHLVVDATAWPLNDVIELLASAASKYWANHP